MAPIGKVENKLHHAGAGRHKVALTFVLGLVLGSIATWIVTGNTALSPTVLPDASSFSEDAALIDLTSVEYVVVEDQLEGDRILIKEIALLASSWAVVHEDAGGVPGNALGAQRFDKGIHSGTIDLLRMTNVDQNYYVLLYLDNGDREFDLDVDTLITDTDGSPLGDTFQAIRIDRKIN